MPVLGLHCSIGFSPLAVASWDYALVAMHWFLSDFSCCRACALGYADFSSCSSGLSSCGSWALEHRLSSCGALA